MEAVGEDLDTLASLEERISRAVQAISSLRAENGQLREKLKSSESQVESIGAELAEAQALSSEYQKENSLLEERVSRHATEMQTLLGERKEVKARIEKLLGQLDLLSAD